MLVQTIYYYTGDEQLDKPDKSSQKADVNCMQISVYLGKKLFLYGRLTERIERPTPVTGATRMTINDREINILKHQCMRDNA